MSETDAAPVAWHEVVDAVPGGVAVTVDGTFVHVSPAFAEAVGVPPAAIDGDDWARVVTEDAAAVLRDEAIPQARKTGRWCGAVVEAESESAVDLTLSATDGGALVWTVPELGDDAAAAIRGGPAEPSNLERCATIVESVDDGVYALDETLSFAYVNEGLCGILGRSREELLGTNPMELMDYGDEVALAEENRRRVVENDTTWGSVTATAETPDGERILESRYRLYPEPDGEYRGSVGIVRDVTQRERRERSLERQRDELTALDRINELLLETVRELVGTASRDAVERVVCDRLAASDLYEFAWVGRRAFDGDRIRPRVTAGDDRGYLDAVTITADESETGQGPAGRAIRTATVQVDAVDDDSFGPWATAARERGFESVAAVPLRRDDTVYGVMAVYSTRKRAFTERERAGLGVLGRTVGTVIGAARSRELLFADAVVELEFDLSDADTAIGRVARDLDCELALDGYVASNEQWILYLDVRTAAPDAVAETIGEESGVERARVLRDAEGAGEIEVVVSSSSLLHTVAAAGANLRTAVSGPDGHRLVVEAPAGGEIRNIVERVRTEFPGASLLARRECDRSVQTVGRPADLLGDLTDRQREVLEAAYRSGYFAWPRESTAEEIAATLDLSAPTLHGHLRKAEASILSALIDGE